MTEENSNPDNDRSSAIDLNLLQNLVVGIGEVSEITGMSQRKLRYWEDRSIIQSIIGNKGSTRRYDYLNIKKILLIKDLIDQGYTLDAANRIVIVRMEKIHHAFQKLIASGQEVQDDTQNRTQE